MGAGAGAVTLAVAVTAIGTLATQGEQHPSRAWFEVAAVIALVGVVLVVIGWTGEHLTHTVEVPQVHGETLRGTATRLRDGLALGRTRIDWGDGYQPRAAFHAHYPPVSHELDEWEVLTTAASGAVSALSKRMTAEAQDVARRSEGRWALPNNLGGNILRSTLARARDDSLDAEYSIEDDVLWKSKVMRDAGESREDWEARADRNRARVEQLGRASEGWPETVAVAQTDRRMEAFRRDRLPAVVQRLQLILEQPVSPMAKGCPTCEGTTDDT
jgi:hypothetical protein